MNRPPTKFETRVFEATCQIPSGKVSTYQDIARYLHCGSSQAIGQALKRNPFAPEVPCHRVVKTDLSLGGFFGESEGLPLDEKKRLLLDEGVVFSENGRVKPECRHFFGEDA
jgi:methylated-DNA-[protein]-cysteine S-methyltransferase